MLDEVLGLACHPMAGRAARVNFWAPMCRRLHGTLCQPIDLIHPGTLPGAELGEEEPVVVVMMMAIRWWSSWKDGTSTYVYVSIDLIRPATLADAAANS